MIAQLQRNATEAKIKAAQDLQNERVQEVKYGSTLDENLVESRAQSLQAKQQLLTTELQLSDLTLQLDDLIGLPLTTELALDTSVPAVQNTCEREACIKTALKSHPETIAREEVRKAAAGAKLSKADYVPDVSAFAQYSYQDNVPSLPATSAALVFSLNTIFSMAGGDAAVPRATLRWPRQKKTWSV